MELCNHTTQSQEGAASVNSVSVTFEVLFSPHPPQLQTVANMCRELSPPYSADKFYSQICMLMIHGEWGRGVKYKTNLNLDLLTESVGFISI